MRDPYLPAPRKPRHQFPGYGLPADSGETFYYDDFFGDQPRAEWAVLADPSGSTEEIIDSSGGAFELALSVASEAQDAVLDHGDLRSFDIQQRLIFETRVKFTVATGTQTTAVWGLASDHATTKDSIDVNAWFRIAPATAAMDILIETDDTSAANNNDDVDTGLEAVLGSFNTYTIDFSDTEDVKFFINGRRKGQTTTFAMTTLTAAESLVQPYFSMSKGSQASLGTMLIDYVKIWQTREA